MSPSGAAKCYPVDQNVVDFCEPECNGHRDTVMPCDSLGPRGSPQPKFIRGSLTQKLLEYTVEKRNAYGH